MGERESQDRPAGAPLPTVSVVVPIYERADSVSRLVRSILDDPTPAEVVIVDDASSGPDPLANVPDDPRLIVRRRAENGGVAAAQNTGLHAATGDFVVFVHSDDAWCPGRIHQQLAVIALAPWAGAVESATTRITGAVEKDVGPLTGPGSHKDLLHRRVKNLHISGFLFRRERLLDVGGFDPQLRCFEDLDLLIRFTESNEIALDHGPAVARIDQGAEGRLGHSPAMAQARLTLVDKYGAKLAHTPPLPRGWRDWFVTSAERLLESGKPDDRAHARQLLHRASRRRLRERVIRLHLHAATSEIRAVRSLGGGLLRLSGRVRRSRHRPR
jgi:glycosyltransferase involved in cell wall biosynthesis